MSKDTPITDSVYPRLLDIEVMLQETSDIDAEITKHLKADEVYQVMKDKKRQLKMKIDRLKNIIGGSMYALEHPKNYKEFLKELTKRAAIDDIENMVPDEPPF